MFPCAANAYRPYLLRKPWLIFFLTVVLTSEAVVVLTNVAQESSKSFLAAVLPADVIRLTNEERERGGVVSLEENFLLSLAADAKAKDMARKGYFAHTGPDGKTPWEWLREFGYAYAAAGENLAVRFHESADVVRAWMASPSHRANILRAGYTDIGVGLAEGTYQGVPATFVVQYFARPWGVAPPPPASVVLGKAEPYARALTAATEHSVQETVVQNMVRLGAEPTQSAMFVLGGVAAVLIVLLGVTLVVNVQVQPVDMLAGGTVVAAITLGFIVLNLTFLNTAGSPQTAAIFNAAGSAVLIGEEGATTIVREI